MGMFDRLYDEQGGEWQTKAYWCGLDAYRIGDEMPPIKPWEPDDYQVDILGETPEDRFTYSFATIQGGVLTAVHAPRDTRLARFNYAGHEVEPAPVADPSGTGETR